MRKQFRIAIVFLIVVIAGGLWWRGMGSHPPDPSYQGKRLSGWLKEFDPSVARTHDPTEAAYAVRQIGTNALPLLNQMIGSKDSRQWWISSAKFIDNNLSFTHLPINPGANRRERAVHGFEALGSAAKPAIPELMQALFQQPENFAVSLALAAIGREAIPSLMNGLTNSDAKIRYATVCTLANLGRSSDAEVIVPILITCLHDKNDDVRHRAAFALHYFRAQSGIIIPVLIESLKDSDFKIRTVALYDLGEFGTEARTALPAIQNALADTNENVRAEATNALVEIDPEAAAKSGIK